MSTKALIVSLAPYIFALLTAEFRFIIPSEYLYLLEIHKHTQIWNHSFTDFYQEGLL